MTEGTGTPEITPYACLLYMHFPHVRAVLEHNGNRKADRQATVGGGGHSKPTLHAYREMKELAYWPVAARLHTSMPPLCLARWVDVAGI